MGQKRRLFVQFSLGKLPVLVDRSWSALNGFYLLSVLSELLLENMAFTTTEVFFFIVLLSLLLFLSVLIHELSHALTAAFFGIRSEKVTLSCLGGMTYFNRPFIHYREAIYVSLGGVIATAIIVILLDLSLGLIPPETIWAIGMRYLWIINLGFLFVNSLPILPMDGGQVLRGVIWGITGEPFKSTYRVSRLGVYLSVALIAFGVMSIFLGRFFFGATVVGLGLFLWWESDRTGRLAQIQERLGKERVGDWASQPGITAQLPQIAPEATLAEALLALEHAEALAVGARVLTWADVHRALVPYPYNPKQWVQLARLTLQVRQGMVLNSAR